MINTMLLSVVASTLNVLVDTSVPGRQELPITINGSKFLTIDS
jgi:hypothetical protein